MDIKQIRQININYLAEKYTRETIANKCGYDDTGYINQLCAGHGSFGGNTARKIEKAFNLEHGWLDQLNTNHGDRTEEAKAKHMTSNNQGLVPVISWVQAGNWNEAMDIYNSGDAERYLPCAKRHSATAFALIVQGDSMTSPHGRSYPEGSVIFVDPELRGSVTSGDRIIAKLDGHNAVTFKQLATESGKQYLKPLNPTHPPIFEKFKVLGKVIGTWIDE